MDPQKLSQLDPKLRDAYQRVMGTVIPESQTPPVQAQTPVPPIPDPVPTPQPQPEAIPAPITEPTTGISTPAVQPEPFLIPQPTPTQDPATPVQPPAQASNFVQMNSEIPAAPVTTPNFTAPVPLTQTVAIKKKNGMMIPVLFGIVGLIFIVIYTIFWTRIFNVKLPFLP